MLLRQARSVDAFGFVTRLLTCRPLRGLVRREPWRRNYWSLLERLHLLETHLKSYKRGQTCWYEARVSCILVVVDILFWLSFQMARVVQGDSALFDASLKLKLKNYVKGYYERSVA